MFNFGISSSVQKIIGLDISKDAIRTARRFIRNSYLKYRVKFLCMRIEEAFLPFASFDMVFSFSVLEHIDNLRDVLKEIFRILKPKGQFHISVDSLATIKDENLLSKHKHDHLVIQYFTEDSLRRQLEAVGFEVIDIYPILIGEFARKEFEKGIFYGKWSKNLLDQILLFQKFLREDKKLKGREGLILIGRACRPV